MVDHPSSYLIRWIAAQLEGRPVHLSQQQSVDSQIQVAKPSKVPHYGNPEADRTVGQEIIDILDKTLLLSVCGFLVFESP